MYLLWKPIQREKIKISEIQPRFVEKPPIDLKLGVVCICNGDFLNSDLETDLEKKSK